MNVRPRTVKLIREVTALPALPAVTQRLLTVLRDPDYSADAVTEVIRTDQALAARVLKLANSPVYGCSGNIKDVGRAVVMLGARSLRNLVTTAGVATAVEKLGNGLDLAEFWRHAAYTATAARVLALRSGHPHPEEAFLLGLIHDIGELVLAVIRPEEYAELAAFSPGDRHDEERRLFGMSHARVGAALISAWNLPGDLCDGVRLHHSCEEATAPDNRTLALVSLADLISRVAGRGHEPPVGERHLRLLFKATRFERRVTPDILREIDLRYLETARYLTPASAGIQAPFARSAPDCRAVVMTGDPDRQHWLTSQLLYHALPIVPVDTFLECPDAADLVLVDPLGVDRSVLEALAPRLERSAARLAIYGTPDLATGEIPVLPLIFSLSDIEALLPAGVSV